MDAGSRDRATRVRSLAVRDFRNLERVDLELPAAGLVLVGDNGQGKTNLLEAIYYLQLLRSARGARDVDLVRFGAEGFHVKAAMESDRASETSVGFARAGKRKRVMIDGAPCERLGDAVGALPAVMFSPTDVDLVAGAPSARRRFLDVMLGVTSRGYLRALQRYRAALVRRNAALRDTGRGGATDARVEVWEAPLAEHGAVLWSERRAWVERMHERFAERCAAIGEERPVRVRYTSALPLDCTLDEAHAELLRALERQRSVDRKLGLTRSGPHRDDLTVTIESDGGVARDLRLFGSAGQQRTAAIALRLLEAETLRERRGGTPMMLLDDPFAELDARRAGRIIELLASDGLGQTVLAVPRESDIPRGLTALEHYRIVGGAIAHA